MRMFPVIDVRSDGPTWPTAAVFLGLEGTKKAPHLNRDAGLHFYCTMLILPLDHSSPSPRQFFKNATKFAALTG